MWSLTISYPDRDGRLIESDVDVFPYAHIGLLTRWGYVITYHHVYDDGVILTNMYNRALDRYASFRYDPPCR